MKKILIVIVLVICLAGAAFWFFTTGNTNDNERMYMELVIEGKDIKETVNVLQKRLESYGVKDLRTESLEQNVLTISLPPQDSMQCIRKLMCTKGKLEIRPTFTGYELQSSLIKLWQNAIISLSDFPLGLKSLPPLPPPIGSPVSEFLKICSNPKNLMIPILTDG